MNDSKICLFCTHFAIDSGTCHYSAETPGDDLWLGCRKGHWKFDIECTTEEEYAENMLMALKCCDYKLSDFAKTLLDAN